MEIVWITIAFIVGLMVGGTGGAIIAYPIGIKDAPKTNMIIQNQDSQTTVDTRNESVQNANQVTVSMTFLDAKSVEVVTLKLDGITNIKVRRSDYSNTSVKTNFN